MTILKVLQKVDRLKPNVIDDSYKAEWVAELNGRIATEVLRLETPVELTYPDDLEEELLVPFPYSVVYELYLSAMIDYAHGEIDNYNNSVLMFQRAFDVYTAHYMRTNPGRHIQFKFIM